MQFRMKIIDKIDDMNGYIYVIEFESTDVDINAREGQRVDVKCVTEDTEPFYYIIDPGIYCVDSNSEPVFVDSYFEESQLLNQAIELIQAAEQNNQLFPKQGVRAMKGSPSPFWE